jgi:hypothetical protein
MITESNSPQINEEPAARYANYFEIGHNAAEFILDFGQAYSTGKERQLHTRIVTSPSYAKALQRLLEKSIEQHEQIYGKIHYE